MKRSRECAPKTDVCLNLRLAVHMVDLSTGYRVKAKADFSASARVNLVYCSMDSVVCGLRALQPPEVTVQTAEQQDERPNGQLDVLVARLMVLAAVLTVQTTCAIVQDVTAPWGDVVLPRRGRHVRQVAVCNGSNLLSG